MTIAIENIVLGTIDSDGTCLAWLEGSLYQSVGANPITLVASGKTKNELKQEAKDIFRAGYDAINTPPVEDVSNLSLQEIEDVYSEKMIRKIRKLSSITTQADIFIEDFTTKLKKATKVIKDVRDG